MKRGFVALLAVAAALTVPTVVVAQNAVVDLQLKNRSSSNPAPARLDAIAQNTIGNLQRANSATISGEVIRVQRDDFILSDGTGQILVEAESSSVRQANLRVGDRVTVAGNYDEGNSFEALSITPENGTVIYVFDD